MLLNWKTGGLLPGLVFFATVLLVKPIGVSTQFAMVDRIVADAIAPDLITNTDGGRTASNANLANLGGKYAKAVSIPLNYDFVFVAAMIALAFALPTRMLPKAPEMLPAE